MGARMVGQVGASPAQQLRKTVGKADQGPDVYEEPQNPRGAARRDKGPIWATATARPLVAI